jgi:hypothetical protein
VEAFHILFGKGKVRKTLDVDVDSNIKVVLKVILKKIPRRAHWNLFTVCHSILSKIIIIIIITYIYGTSPL